MTTINKICFIKNIRCIKKEKTEEQKQNTDTRNKKNSSWRAAVFFVSQ